MQGSSVLRFILFALGGLLLFKFLGGSGDSNAPTQAIQKEPQVVPAERAPYRYCDIWTQEFQAQLTSRGATIKHFRLLTAKYTRNGTHIDLSTTPHPGIALGESGAEDPKRRGDHEFRQQLFVNWRNPTIDTTLEVPFNVAFDSVDYHVTQADGKTCEFVYRDQDVELRKQVSATDRPYELLVRNSIKNLASAPRRHAMAIDTVAWRLNHEVEGSLFTVSPYITHVECKAHENVVRLLPDSFEPSDFEGPEFQTTQPWGFYQGSGTPAFTAISNAYFSQALVPLEAPASPVCQLQIENRFRKDRSEHLTEGDASDPASGRFYRARLAYPEAVLAPGESHTYNIMTYVGPKERQLLAAAGGRAQDLTDLIDLGFFSAIAKVLVGFLLAVYDAIPNWGVAIIILTLTARLLLFPLMWPGIKNMIRMREMKPEIDALNEKYKDDARAKGLAQMELYKKHNVNLFMGCLPTLATMPVWFALYTTLQTAVELYNIPFLWFPDLSEPDPYFVLPFIIGATYFVQQKMMPMQGDPVQQKMMLYFMPGMFTVFMLFLPAGLGVYMFTNSILGIVQQQAVEWHAKRSTGRDVRGNVVGSTPPAAPKGASKPAKKTKATPNGEKTPDSKAKRLGDGRPLLDKGKA